MLATDMLKSVAEDATRLYVIEGQVLFAKALCQVFAADKSIEVVGDAQSVDETAVARARPDVVILDLDGTQSAIAEGIERCRSIISQTTARFTA